jgi:endo-1,4-beta-xylanase
MKHFLRLIVFISLLNASCTSSPSQRTITPFPNLTLFPVSTPVVGETPTPMAQTNLKEDAPLYAGPSNEGYETIAQLKKGMAVHPLGIFVDFVQVETLGNSENVIGFVTKSALEELSPEIPELGSMDIPWVSVDILNNFIDHRTSFEGNSITVDNTKANILGFQGAADSYLDILGAPMDVEGPFRITFNLESTKHEFASLKFTNKENSVEGLWWQGIRRLDFTLLGSNFQIDIRDGISEQPQTILLQASIGQTITVTFLDPYGKKFTITDKNGKTQSIDVTTLTDLELQEGLFPERKAYIGCVTPPNAKVMINDLSLQKAPSGKLANLPTSSNPSLRELGAQQGISIGNALWLEQLRNAGDRDIMFRDYGVAILSDFSIKDFWRGRGDYDFESVDNAVNWVVRNGWKVRASHLVWGDYNTIPDWLINGHFSRDEYIQILEEHVKTVVSHYKGSVAEWSIANEAISRLNCSRCDFWRDKIGLEYIEMAFRWAREADPDGILIFNETNNESPRDAETQRVFEKMYSIVAELKSKGVPIDVVGMQMHLLAKWSSPIVPNKADVIQTMQEFARLGVDIYITEFDVTLDGRRGTQEDRWKYQATIYRDMIEACLESRVCKSFSTWGISDKDSWITCTKDWYCAGLPDADPLMFDKYYQPEPAYFAVRDVLLQAIISTPNSP